MALVPTKLINSVEDIASARGLVVINYGSDQTVSSATSGLATFCRGLYVTTAGTLSVVPVGMDAVVASVPFAVGWHPLALTEIKNTGSATAVGYYYF